MAQNSWIQATAVAITAGAALFLGGCNDNRDTTSVTRDGWTISVEQNALKVGKKGRTGVPTLSTVGIDNPITARIVQVETSENRAIFDIEQTPQKTCDQAEFDGLEETGDKVTVSGRFTSQGCASLRFELLLDVLSPSTIEFELGTNTPSFNNLRFAYQSNQNERFYGFGEQYSFLDLKGQTVPILSQEQGIGRGGQPLTSIVNGLFPGAAGDAFTTYYPVPQYVTSANRGLSLANSEFSVFDLSSDDRVEIELLNPRMSGHLYAANDMLGVISAFTNVSGRMAALPDWVHSGAILGLQGGTDAVREKLAPLQAAGAPIAAVWLQDWVGQRETLGGAARQLWWNWELDEQRYPGWESLVAELNNEGIEIMGYVNPFLVDVSERDNVERNLYQEARNLGYLVTNDAGQPVQTTITDFTAGIVDLTNPDARTWLSDIIQTNMLDIGFKGWMADFGEALPLEFELDNGQPALSEHNLYPERWAKLNADSIEQHGAEEIVYFMRSGFTGSPGKTSLFWLGDQATTWDKSDGLQSAIIGLINGGFSGISLNHADIGGYTSLAVPITPEQASQFPAEVQIPCSAVGLGNGTCAALARTPELLVRWMEMSAFTAIFRTHEGLSPVVNAQVFTENPAGSGNYPFAQAFSLASNVYAALADYRKDLFAEAENQGYPVVRHPLLHYPDDTWFQAMSPEDIQFMLGEDFMIAPIVTPTGSLGPADRHVHLPEGQWVDLWTGDVRSVPEGGTTFSTTAALGQPPVWFRGESNTAVAAASAIQTRLAPFLNQ